MDNRLLEIIVCPICKGPLKLVRRGATQTGATSADGVPALQGELICVRDHLAFPIRDDIPVMLVDQARHIND